jgi:hypothetical protein
MNNTRGYIRMQFLNRYAATVSTIRGTTFISDNVDSNKRSRKWMNYRANKNASLGLHDIVVSDMAAPSLLLDTLLTLHGGNRFYQ